LSYSKLLYTKTRLLYLLLGNKIVRPAYRAIQITKIRLSDLFAKNTVDRLSNRLVWKPSVSRFRPKKINKVSIRKLGTKIGRRLTLRNEPPATKIVLFVIQSAVHLEIWVSLERICNSLQARGLNVAILSNKEEVLAHGEALSMIPISAKEDRKVVIPILEAKRMLKALKKSQKTRKVRDANDDFEMFRQSLTHPFQNELAKIQNQKQHLAEVLSPYEVHSVLLAPFSSGTMPPVVDIFEGRAPVFSFTPLSVAAHRRSVPVNWAIDGIFCTGTEQTEAFEKLGHLSEQLYLTGNPKFDHLSGVRRSSGTERMLLVATSAIDPEETNWINFLLRHLMTKGNWRMVIKIHPDIDEERYRSLVQGGELAPVQVTKSIPVSELILDCSILATDYSTCGVEAAVGGKPVLVVNQMGADYPSNNFDQEGVGLLARSFSETIEVFEQLVQWLDKPEFFPTAAFKTYQQRYNHLNDGKAAERIARILENR